jgi:hypothetical protein
VVTKGGLPGSLLRQTLEPIPRHEILLSKLGKSWSQMYNRKLVGAQKKTQIPSRGFSRFPFVMEARPVPQKSAVTTSENPNPRTVEIHRMIQHDGGSGPSSARPLGRRCRHPVGDSNLQPSD